MFAQSGLGVLSVRTGPKVPGVPSLPRLRPAVRVLLVDPADRVLLVRWRFADVDVWGTPGGGIDAGESHADAVRRELREETGWELGAEGPGTCLAHRVHVIAMENGLGARWDGQEEWFYLLRVPAFEPRGAFTDEQLRDELVHELAWFTLTEVETLSDAGVDPPVRTAPSALASLLERILTGPAPGVPLELEV